LWRKLAIRHRHPLAFHESEQEANKRVNEMVANVAQTGRG
jgi:hypothetical protein